MSDPATLKQIDYLANEVAKLESTMIDPVQFGEMKGHLTALKTELDGVKTKQAQMDLKIDMVLDKLSEAKGGWRLLMLLGGAGATMVGVVTWFATHTFTIGPR